MILPPNPLLLHQEIAAKQRKIGIERKKSWKNLQVSKISRTFAPAIKEIPPRFAAETSGRMGEWLKPAVC